MNSNTEKRLRKMLHEEGSSIQPDQTALRKIFDARKQKSFLPRLSDSRVLLGGSLAAIVTMFAVSLFFIRGAAEWNTADQAANISTTQLVIGLEELRDNYEEVYGHPTVQSILDSCLAENGFSEEYEQLRAKSKSIMQKRANDERWIETTYGDSQLYFGPSNYADAEEYGMNSDAWNGSESKLHLNKEDSEKELECLEKREAFQNANGVSIRDIDIRLIDFGNNLSEKISAYVDEQAFKNIAREHVSCVAENGYPGLDIDILIETRGFGEQFPGTDVFLGHGTGTVTVEPSEDADTRLSVSTQNYIPTDDEVALAKVFVDCGKSTGAHERSVKLNDSLTAQAEEDVQVEALAIQREIESFNKTFK